MPISRTPIRMPARRRAVPTSTRLRTHRVPLAAYVVLLLALPVGAYALAKATGVWSATGRPGYAAGQGRDVAVDPPGGGAAIARGPDAATAPPPATPSPSSGAGKGSGTGQSTGSRVDGNVPRTPDEVKGWHTVAQVVAGFPSVTAAEVFGMFGVRADTPTSRQLKDLAADGNGFEIPDLRAWLSRHD